MSSSYFRLHYIVLIVRILRTLLRAASNKLLTYHGQEAPPPSGQRDTIDPWMRKAAHENDDFPNKSLRIAGFELARNT